MYHVLMAHLIRVALKLIELDKELIILIESCWGRRKDANDKGSLSRAEYDVLKEQQSSNIRIYWQ